MISKLSAAYERIQRLQIAPTKSNMEILLSTLAIIQQAVTYIEKLEGEKKDVSAGDEGRDKG